MIERAESKILRSLDLVKFVQQQRMQTLAILALLTPPQLQLINRRSEMRIHETSDLENNDIQKERAVPNIIRDVQRRMIEKIFNNSSNNPVD